MKFSTSASLVLVPCSLALSSLAGSYDGPDYPHEARDVPISPDLETQEYAARVLEQYLSMRDDNAARGFIGDEGLKLQNWWQGLTCGEHACSHPEARGPA